MSDTYTAPATPVSLAARLAALEVKQGGSEIVQLLIRLYRILLLGAQTDLPLPGDELDSAKQATVFDAASSSMYQAVFGEVLLSEDEEGNQKYCTDPNPSFFARVFPTSDAAMPRYTGRPIEQLVCGTGPEVFPEREDHAPLLGSYPNAPRRRLGKIVGKLTLLLRVQPTAHYKPRFDFPGVIARTFRANADSADFARNLEKEIAFRIERAAQRTPSPRVSRDGPVAPFRRSP